MNKTVGDLLREARNKKGLALQNIERSTGIATHNLLAIELDQFSLIEADKLESYLQTYAKEVEVPYASLMAASGFPNFAEPTPAPVQETVAPVAPISVEKQVKANFETIVKNNPAPQSTPANLRRTDGRSGKSGKEKSGGFFKLVVSLLLTAAVLFAGYTLYKQYFADVLTKKEAPAASSASSSSSSASASSSAASSSTPAGSSTTASSSSAPASDTKLAVTGGGDYLEVKATTSTKPVKVELSLSGAEKSWVSMVNSDLGEVGTMLNSEQPKLTATMFDGVTQGILYLGVTKGVTVKINGQTLDMSSLTSTANSTIVINVE